MGSLDQSHTLDQSTTNAVAVHEAATDPHTGYLKESEGARTYNIRSATSGTSDDTSAIQAVHDAAADGDTLFLQPGTYTVSQLNWTKKLNIIGLGTPEQVVLKAKSGMTGPLLNVNFASLKHHLRLENFYVDMTGATGQVGVYLNNLDFGRIQNVKVREGTVAFDIDSVAATRFDQCLAFNNRTSGFRVKNAAAIGNTYFDCKFYMTSGAAADCTVAGWDLQNGASHYFLGCEVLRTPGISFNLPYGIYLHSPATTDWLFMTSCYVDGITDGTANSASSAAVYVTDSDSVFISNSFLSANDSSGKKERGLRIDTTNQVVIQGGRISGSGLEFVGTCNSISVLGTNFPASYSDAALNFGSATVTNLTVNVPTPGAALANDYTKFNTAIGTAPIIGTPKIIRKTITESVTSNAIQDDDELKLTVGTNDVWWVEGLILVTAANTTMDYKAQWSVPASATMLWGLTVTSGMWLGAAVGSTPVTLNAATSSRSIGTAAGTIGVLVYGLYTGGGTAGTLQFRWSQDTTDAGNLTVEANSILRCTRLA